MKFVTLFPTRPAVPLGLCVFAALLLLGCHGGAQTDEDGAVMQASLQEISPEPASEEKALAEREALLKDIRLHLAAITGQQTGSTHPSLVELEQNAQQVRDGLNLLYLERDLHGLSWYNAISDLLAGLERQYAVLEQIREHLEALERESPPSAEPHVE